MGSYPRMEVCRDFMDDKCKRDESSCKYAHPPKDIEISYGKVICCVDFLQNRCNRTDPPCRYFHPPRHIKRYLLERIDRGDKRGSRTKYRDRERSRSPRRGNNYNDNYSNNNYNQENYGGRFPVDNIGLENAVVNTLLPQLLILKEQILSSLSVGMQSSNLEANLQNYRALMGANNMEDNFRDRDRSPYSSRRDNAKNDTFEVCRDFLNGACNRFECKYAHPPTRIEINDDNTVTICLRSLSDNCQFDDCKYYHLPDHLRKIFGNKHDSGYFPKRRRNDRDEDFRSKRQRRH